MQREVYGVTGVVRAYWHGTLTEDKQDKTLTNYRRNRYYDPATGRFTQEDPIGFAGGLNLYGFANGDPVTYSDPYGLSAQKCPPNCDNPSVLGAFAHYMRGSGKNLSMDFGRVNLSRFNVLSVPEAYNSLSGGEGVYSNEVSGSAYYTVPGWQNNLLGTIRVDVQGTLKTVCADGSCAWDFQGSASAKEDTYDFNRSTHRSSTAENLTTVGRNAPGVPYKILFGGSQEVNQGGEYNPRRRPAAGPTPN